MSRPSLPVLVVLVLAVSGATVAGAVTDPVTTAASPVVGTTAGEPNHLAMDDSAVAASNTTTLGLDVVSAISTDSGSLHSTYVDLEFQRAYENASTDTARMRVVSRFAEWFANRTAALEERNAASIEAYASGAITADQFARQRARINSLANQLRQAAGDITNRIPRRLRGPMNQVNGRLEVIQGPIGSRLADSIIRTGDAETVYVEVSDSGYTLARISGGMYTRETYLREPRYPTQPDRFANGTGGLGAAENRVFELYPWVRDNPRTIRGALRVGPGIYRITMGIPGGERRVYLSGGTRNVFREHQRRSLESFNTTRAINRTEGSVRLTVNRTYATGPAQITLRNPSTGAPIDGTVTVGRHDAVSVGDDGTLWIVEPRGDVRINATAGTAQFSTTLSGN